MANKALFKSAARVLPSADTQNEAGGVAYSMPAKHALAQLAATGCLNNTFYATAETQLQKVLDLAKTVDPEFVAKTAVYARERAFMKDMPALLCAVLSSTEQGRRFLPLVFGRVIDSPKMLSNYVQIVRSGVAGRKSLGSMPKRLIQRWLDARTDDQLFRGSVGVSDPSLVDIVRMVHPQPKTDARRSLYGYLSGRNPKDFKAARSGHFGYRAEDLPTLVQSFEAFKADPKDADVPEVPFLMLTSLPLDVSVWTRIAEKTSWQTLRMNLNTFLRHGVFADADVVRRLAARLRDRKEIQRAKVFPYQLLTAYTYADPEIPHEIRDALHDAMEVAVENVPVLSGNTVVCVDVSGSMHSPVTGSQNSGGTVVRKGRTFSGGTSKVQCIDVAALVAASILRRNPRAEILVFSDHVHQNVHVDPRDTVMTNAKKLMKMPSGGTNCSAPIAYLNHYKKSVDTVVMVSDNESWVDSRRDYSYSGHRGATAMLEEWQRLRGRCKGAKLVCLDLQPNTTTQVVDRPDILNLGGFSDACFELMSLFAGGVMSSEHWVGEVNKVSLATG